MKFKRKSPGVYESENFQIVRSREDKKVLWATHLKTPTDDFPDSMEFLGYEQTLKESIEVIQLYYLKGK